MKTTGLMMGSETGSVSGDYRTQATVRGVRVTLERLQEREPLKPPTKADIVFWYHVGCAYEAICKAEACNPSGGS